MKKNICFLEKPVSIYDLRKTYSDDVEFITDTDVYPMATGIRYDGPLNKAIKGKLPAKSVKIKADRLVELYKRRLFHIWDDHMDTLVDKVSSVGLAKGGPGSGCQGPNCGRPEGSGMSTSEFHEPAYEDRPKLNIQDVRPAIKYKGKIFIGNKGDDHNDIRIRLGDKIMVRSGVGVRVNNWQNLEEGFVDSKASGNWMSRKETARRGGQFLAENLRDIQQGYKPYFKFEKADENEDEETRKKRKAIAEALGIMSLFLAGSALPFYKRAYLLGKERGVSISGKDMRQALTDSESQKLLGLTEENKKYLDNFMKDLEDKYVEAVQKEYDDEKAREEEIKRITQANEARLSMYATAALAALAAGMTSGILEGQEQATSDAEDQGVEPPPEITGMIWVTAKDDAVCPGCADNDGKFFTMDEFEDEYQSNECLVRCRCAETSVPTSDPQKNFGRSAKLSDLRKNNTVQKGVHNCTGKCTKMCKGGPGSGCNPAVGVCGRPKGSGSAEDREVINAEPTKYARMGVTNGSPVIRSILRNHKYDEHGAETTALFSPEFLIEPKKYPMTPGIAGKLLIGGMRKPTENALVKYPKPLQEDLLGKIDEVKRNGRLSTGAQHRQRLNVVTGEIKNSIELADDVLENPKLTDLVMTHEMAHALDYSYNKKVGSSISDTKEFKEVMLGQGVAISKYSLNNEKEFFAEHVTAFIHKPGYLKTINPGVYGYMEKLFAGTQTFTKGMRKAESGQVSDADSLVIDDDFDGSIIWAILEADNSDMNKGGPGSGCQGPNCGRPKGSGSSDKIYPMESMIEDAKLAEIHHESSRGIPRGWLLPKDRGIIVTPKYADSEYAHKDILQSMGRSWNQALNEGLVRKASEDSYQFGEGNQDAIDSVQADLKANYGQMRETMDGNVYIDEQALDSKHPADGKIARSYVIPKGKLLANGIDLRALMTDEHMVKMAKGGPGSGCTGPNCGRPKESGTIESSGYLDKIKNSLQPLGTLYHPWSPTVVEDDFSEKTLNSISAELKRGGARGAYRFLYSPNHAEFAVLPWSMEHGTAFDDFKAKGELNGEIDKNWIRGIYTKGSIGGSTVKFPLINLTYWGHEKEYESGTSYKTYMDAVQDIVDNKGFSDDTYLETQEIYGNLKTGRTLGEWRKAVAAYKLEKGGPGSGCNPAAGVCGRPKGSGKGTDIDPGYEIETVNPEDELTIIGRRVREQAPYFDDFNNRTVEQVAGKLEVGGEIVKTPEEHALSESMVNMEVMSHDTMGNFERNYVRGTSTISKFVSKQIQQYPDHLQNMISKKLNDIYFVDNLPNGVAGRFLRGRIADGINVSKEIGRIEMSEMIYRNASITKSRIDMMVTHELAHAIDYSYKDQYGNIFSESKSWKAAMVDGQPISSYAKKNWRENFAESVTAYMYIPDHLKKASPKSFEVLDKLFKNVKGLEFVKMAGVKDDDIDILDDFKGSIIEILSDKITKNIDTKE